MRGTEKATSQDSAVEGAFGLPVAELYARARGGTVSAAAHRVLEIRSHLALVEEQVAWVRDRIHQATAPGTEAADLDADGLRFDAQLLAAALATRREYTGVLEELLRTMPAQAATAAPPVPFAQMRATVDLPPAAGGSAASVSRSSPGPQSGPATRR